LKINLLPVINDETVSIDSLFFYPEAILIKNRLVNLTRVTHWKWSV